MTLISKFKQNRFSGIKVSVEYLASIIITEATAYGAVWMYVCMYVLLVPPSPDQTLRKYQDVFMHTGLSTR